MTRPKTSCRSTCAASRTIADYMVIRLGPLLATGRGHVGKAGRAPEGQLSPDRKIEGKETGDWVLIDTGDVIVHIFRPEVREFYQLEKMWMPATAASQ